MRGFGGRGKPDEFAQGFIWGLGSAVGLAVVLRGLQIVARLESVNEAIDAIAAALTTPVLSVSDLLTVVAVLFLVGTVVAMSGYLGGFRA